MPKPSQTASQASAFELERIAATETATAYNEEHRRQGERHARAVPVILKYWDATLDRRTCPTCASLSGQVRPWGLPFDGGAVPGSAHPNCRCREGTIAAPVIWEGS